MLPVLEGILIASVVSTAIHYTDNYRFIEQYPQPDWITLPSIYITWLLLTAIGALGYWLYRNGKLWTAYLCLLIYALTGLSSLAHYFYGDMAKFSTKMHVFVITDGLTEFAVLAFAVWSGVLQKLYRPERDVSL